MTTTHTADLVARLFASDAASALTNEAARKIEAQAAEIAALQWQPIETARKDGTYVLLCPWGDFPDAFVSFWLAGECRWAIRARSAVLAERIIDGVTK